MSLESDVPQGATVLSAFSPMSFAGLASSLAVWLLSGGTLVLHHPFDEEVLEQQINEQACDTLIAPAQLALRLDEMDLAARMPSLRNVIGLWRTPEQVGSSACWSAQQATLTGCLSVRRGRIVRRAPDRGGRLAGPDQARPARRAARIAGIVDRGRDPADAARHAGIARTDGAGRGLCTASAAERLPDRRRRRATTSIRITRRGSTASTGAINITAPPSGIMAVGGYRFLAQDLQEWARRLGQGALLTALPDRLSGHRLAGRALDNARARDALTELGLNPLMVEAFRDRTNAA